MIFTQTQLKGSYIIELEKLEDERGFFARTFCQREFEAHGLNSNVVQCNISYNKKRGTLRGMHFQIAPYQEAKLIMCLTGSIYDVIVDLRPDSPTYRQWIAVNLVSREQLSVSSFQSATDSSRLTLDAAHSSQLPAFGSQLTADSVHNSASGLQLTAHYGMFYIPGGFAHGFLTLEDETEVLYQMSEFYMPEYARGIRWNDPSFNISWPIDVAVISGKDKSYPDFIL
jgi:dTDP-4-dehydrorhamnose 3,5-epimerase